MSALAAATVLCLVGTFSRGWAAPGEFPRAYAVDRQEVEIPMSDGVRLYACLSLPRARKADERFPALLSTDPYAGKCDPDPLVTAGRPWYASYAQAGYIVAYVHARGTGRSEGVFPPREYSEQELNDAVALIDWLARQPWSTGKVGMFGASWSGFNALQIAMRNPPALKAIVSHVASENMYDEDVRYYHGILHFSDWSGFADLQLITSPPPTDPFDEDTLRKRFDQPPWSLAYLQQQRDGDFWRRSIRLDRPTGHLGVPTLMIGGWYDGYRMAVLRAMEHAQAPVQAVVGPWVHRMNSPAPAADLGQLAAHWWDYWLKDKQNGVLKAPELLAYMRRPYLPQVGLAAVPGEWRAVQRWPPEQLIHRTLYLGEDRSLQEALRNPVSQQLRYVASSGNEAGIWFGNPMPDQRPADAYSLIYESAPVREELHLLGTPQAHLRISTSATRANVMVRLEDVAPDGSVTQITGGAVNGTQRNSSIDPQPLQPGELYDLVVSLAFTSWIFEPGHRIRIAVSNALFPMFWPTPERMTTRIELGGTAGSRVTLPLIPRQSADDAKSAASLALSRNLSRQEADTVPPDTGEHWFGPAHIERDVAGGRTLIRYAYGYPGLSTMLQEYETSDTDPAHSRATTRVSYERKWQDHVVRWQGVTEIKSDAKAFHYMHRRQLLRDGTIVREKVWTRDVPRDFQ